MAWFLDGTAGAYFSVHPSGMSIQAPFTFAGMFNSTSNDGKQLYAVHTGASSHRIYLHIRTSQEIRLSRDAGGTANHVDTTTIAAHDTWGHAAARMVATDDAHVYLDGGNSAQSTTSRVVNAADELSLGVQNGGANDEFDGFLAEWAVWTVALDVAEIESLATGLSPLCVRPSALYSYIPCWRNDPPVDHVLPDAWVKSGSSQTVVEHPRSFNPIYAMCG